MTTSALVGKEAAAASLCAAFAFIDFGSAPAFSSAFETAALMASDVMVAPETTSTFGDWAATMAAGSASVASDPMPGVSVLFTMRTASMRFAETSTSTATSPFLPVAEPAKVPAVIAWETPAARNVREKRTRLREVRMMLF